MTAMSKDRVGLHIPAHYSPDPEALAGKTILVTGASDGIGRSAALHFAQHGATVVLLARSVEKLEAVYDAIEDAGGAQPAAIPFDLKNDNEEAYVELANVVSEQLGSLDGLLLNASVLGERRPLEQASWGAWREVMQVNVNSQFLLLRALLPLLREAASASVILTTSGVGREGRAYWGAYSVSKFATEAMMQILANETENTSNLRVNCINPGATNTAMRRMAYPAEQPDSNPSPDAIMRSYLYLMDDASNGVSGNSFDAQ
jgi:NAD(P)-dependent dehydrogenase (short-subunit alcohol dehydrogenase family)